LYIVVGVRKRGPGEVSVSTCPNMYQICGDPALLIENVAYLSGIRNMDLAHPRVDYLLPYIVNLK
jgi:hypothetical protein